MTQIPYTFDRTHTAAELHEKFENAIETGAHTEEKVSVAGRVMLRRGQGKLAFAALDDTTARIQLFAPADVTQDFSAFTELRLGDWIGAHGTMMKTRKGELSIEVDEWQLLAEAKRPFPDKWHGLTDPDTRYRQRYVDLWVSEDSRKTLLTRARMVSLVRRYFEDRGFLEVETPQLQVQAGGTIARPFRTHHDALDIDMHLRIAPELFLKRLLVGGFEKVFELGRNFRNEGISVRHNPEFTMLEVYDAYRDYHDGMEMIEELVAHLARELCGSTTVDFDGRVLDLATPWRRVTLTELVSNVVGRQVDLETPVEVLRDLVEEHGGHHEESHRQGALLFELYEKTVESDLWDPTFVMDIPKEMSPLARDHRSRPGYAEHADAVVAGREIAPVYSELTDAAEQRARFEEQALRKAAGDEEAMDVDEDFLRALEYGMPPALGFGFGIDRVAQLLTNSRNIKDVLLFPTLRPEQS